MVDEAPMEAQNQAFSVAADGRANGVPIVGVGVGRVVVDEIEVVDAGRHG